MRKKKNEKCNHPNFKTVGQSKIMSCWTIIKNIGETCKINYTNFAEI